MKVTRAIFVASVEAPGGLNRVAYLQTTEPARRDSYVETMRLCDVGLLAGDELYPLHTIRRITLDQDQSEPVVAEPAKRRGRPPKAQKPADAMGNAPTG